MYISDFSHLMRSSVDNFNGAYEVRRQDEAHRNEWPMDRSESEWRKMFSDFILSGEIVQAFAEPVDEATTPD